MTRYLAANLRPLAIRGNTASAGLLDNPTAGLFSGTQELRQTCAAAAPLGRVGTEAELACLVAFLSSPQVSWVSGHSYLACGGLSVGRAMLTPSPLSHTAVAEPEYEAAVNAVEGGTAI